MPLTKITTEIDIPEGFEFDTIREYGGISNGLGVISSSATIILRKKKPKTRWFRAFKIKRSDGLITTDSYSTVNNDQKQGIELILLSRKDFAGWITDWIEYPIE